VTYSGIPLRVPPWIKCSTSFSRNRTTKTDRPIDGGLEKDGLDQGAMSKRRKNGSACATNTAFASGGLAVAWLAPWSTDKLRQNRAIRRYDLRIVYLPGHGLASSWRDHLNASILFAEFRRAESSFLTHLAELTHHSYLALAS